MPCLQATTAFDSSGTVLGSTQMEYKAKKDTFKERITDLLSKPFRVEVTSTGGGSNSIEESEIQDKGR